MIQKVCELIGEVRAEGIANMKQLKKTWGSARPDEEAEEHAAAKVRDLTPRFSLAPSPPIGPLSIPKGSPQTAVADILKGPWARAPYGHVSFGKVCFWC